MKHASVLLQLVLLISGGIAIFFYVLPEFGLINDNQNLTQEYNEAIAQAEVLKDSIVDLQRQRDSISEQSLRALEQYLPTGQMDIISVQRDILAYSEVRNLILEDMFVEQVTVTNSELPVARYKYGVRVFGTYDNIKAFIADLERNVYPLRINELTLSADEIGFTEANFSLGSYRFVSLLGNS